MGKQKMAAVSDMGHTLMKLSARIDGEWTYPVVVPHALHKIPQKRWEDMVSQLRGERNAADYVKVGDKHYVIGETAERLDHATRAMGAARYAVDYITVQTVAMLARVSPFESAEVALMPFYPPADSRYRKQLARVLKGRWPVELGDGRQFMFTIDQVATLAEPVAGYFNAALDENLNEDDKVTGGEALIVDVGGGTVNVAPVLPGGAVDYARAHSYSMGILDVMARLEANLRDKYSGRLQKTRHLAPDRLREALMTYQFKGGGHALPCREEVQQAKAPLLAEIDQLYHNGSIGGPMRYDAVILTGGGAWALGEELRKLLDHRRIVYAAHQDEMHLANIFGGMKTFEVLLAQGALKL